MSVYRHSPWLCVCVCVCVCMCVCRRFWESSAQLSVTCCSSCSSRETRESRSCDRFWWGNFSFQYQTIPTALSVRGPCADSLHRRPCESYRCGEGGQFGCGSDAPPEVVSEPQPRRAGVCVNGKARGAEPEDVHLMVFSLNRSFTRQIKQKWPTKQFYRSKQCVNW